MAAKAKKDGKKAPETRASARDYSIILSPVVTEKSSHIGNGGNTVVFRVDRRAPKEEIKSAFERVFQKKVAAIRTANYVGKPKKRTKSAGTTARYKKAMVTLQEGEIIELA